LKARLVNVGIAVTETFANGLGGGTMLVGIASDTDKYAKIAIPATQADVTVCDNLVDTDAIILEDIAAGVLVQLTLTQSTDSGTAAGKGRPFIDMYCWK